ncbi:hypothetical protein JNM87_03620 [Candidatus Saccharibacteria bacterium]|nr:hypothetical protein [Candidatus Saccharibacteria bacterium]
MQDDIAQQILAKLQALEAGQQEMGSDIRSLQTGQQRLESGQQEMQGDIRNLKAGQQEMSADITSLKKGQSKLERKVDRLEGLFEDFGSKHDYVIDVLLDIQKHTRVIPQMQEDIQTLQSDVKTLSVAISETNRDLHNIDERLIVQEVKI